VAAKIVSVSHFLKVGLSLNCLKVIAQPPLLKSPSEHRGQGHSSSFEAFILTRIVARFQTRSLESSGHRRFSLL